MVNSFRSILGLIGLSCISLVCSAQLVPQKCNKPPIETNTDNFQVLISSDNISGVEQYLQLHTVDLNGVFLKCITPLDVAVDAKHPEMADFLIAHGADINQVDGQGAMPIHRAAHFNNPAMIAYLVKKGAQVDALGSFDMMPLHFAAKAGNLEASEALLKAGANVDGNDSTGKRHSHSSPLQDAIASKHKDVAQLLIAHGANVLTLDVWKAAALDYAGQNKGWSDVVQQIIDKGAECETAHNNSAAIDIASDPVSIRLIIACVTKRTGKAPDLKRALNLAVLWADKDRIQALLGAGADIHSIMPIGQPLNKLASADFTEYLLALGADPNGHDMYGATALQTLARKVEPESVSIAKVLIAHGAKLNESENNPLFGAAQFGHEDMATLLLDDGVNPNLEGQWHQTPLSLAIENNHPAVASLLLERGADPNMLNGQAISLTVTHGQLDVLVKILKKGGNPDGWGDGESPIPVNLSRPLIAAVVSSNLDAARLLLDGGADPNRADADGSTPLHAAAKAGQVDMVALLISHKARTDATDRSGLRPENLTENPAILSLLKRKSISIDKEERHSVTYDGALCNKVAKQMETAAFARRFIEERDEAVPILSPTDDWGLGHEKGIVTSQVNVSGKNLVVDSASSPEVFISQVDKSGVAHLECVLVAEEANSPTPTSFTILDPVDQYIRHSKAASAPLTYAFKHPGTESIALLLSRRNQDPRLAYLKGDIGGTALLYAAIAKGHVDGVRFLLDHKIDPNPDPSWIQSSYEVKTPLSELLGSDTQIHFFLGPQTTPVGFAADNHQFAIAKILLERGADPNSGYLYGAQYKPIYRPASDIDTNMVMLFLTHGADPMGAYMATVGIEHQHQDELLKTLREYGLVNSEEELADQAARCESYSSDAMPLPCLPRVLKLATIEVEKRTEAKRKGVVQKSIAKFDADVHIWEVAQDKECGIQLKERSRDGWISYVLTDGKRAQCVLAKMRQRIAVLAPK